MADYAAEKTHDPTPRRRQQAREAGEFAKSQDLASAAILLAGVGALIWLGHSVAVTLRHFTESQLGVAATLSIDREGVLTAWRQALAALAPVVLPLLGIVLIAAVLVNVLQVGAVWLPQRLAPDWSRVSPLAGWRRIFSLAGVVRLALAILKIGLVGGVAFWSLYRERDTVLSLATLESQQVAAYLAQIVLWTSLKIGAMLLALALVDYGYQWWKHEQSLKMTADELREELRNLQGDPQLVSRRRLVQRQGALKPRSATIERVEAVALNPPSRGEVPSRQRD